MNKKEKELLSELYWWLAEYKNEHHVIYFAKNILQSIIKGKLSVAEKLLMPKSVASFSVPSKQPQVQEVHEPKMNINMMKCPDCGAWYHMSFGHTCSKEKQT